ncbi:hypothetical protein Adt_06715 [Abeliophyllum distichum]|uniref:Uncharacterized protein n=1 Tax=Abeliophyllum distichum TaxID=126358 RepID=A0ABD1V7Q7_9LAMI
MADVMSHGGNSAGDPPQQSSHRLASACESEVPEEQRTRLCSIIESYFDLQGDRLPDEYMAICAAVDRLVADRYCDYKLKAHNHLKAHRPSRPYDEMSAEDW